MQKIRLEITGIRPLLMHDGSRLADPRHPLTRQMKAISSKKRKTDEDYDAMAKLEFIGGMYHDPDEGPYIPDFNLVKCLIKAAAAVRKGKDVERAIIIDDPIMPLIYDGPRDIQGLWDDGRFVNVLPVKVGQSRVMRTRPYFRQWALTAECTLDIEMLNLDDFRAVVEMAGRTTGLCDYRPRFGRFDTVIETL